MTDHTPSSDQTPSASQTASAENAQSAGQAQSARHGGASGEAPSPGRAPSSDAALALRAATSADLPRLRAILEASFAIYVAAIGRRPAPMDAALLAPIAAGHVRIAQRAGPLLGFSLAYPVDNALHLETLAVDPAAQGGGVGRALIAAVEAEAAARGLAAIELYTNAAMDGPLALYPKLGYRIVSRRRVDGFDRVYFRKPVIRAPAP